MTDSTTTNGWFRKSNFDDNTEQESADQMSCKLKLAHAHTIRLLHNNIKEYSQWFKGEANVVADSLSRDFHISDNKQTNLLIFSVPSQLSFSFTIASLPRETELFRCV